MDLIDLLGDGRAADRPAETTCSRKGCRRGADWQVLWNNPKIHTPDRRKTWLACDEHRNWLQEFLALRGFWKETVPLTTGAVVPGSDPHDESEGSN